MNESVRFDPGCVLGRYRIVRRIGKGGMGSVYEVEHIELGVRYALKVFTCESEAFGNMLHTKFLEESQALARLRHPNLTRAYDLVIDTEAGIAYYVMDLVLYKDGNSHSLEDVDTDSVDDDQILKWFRDACSALDYLHDNGIVHRDVKLANMLLSVDKSIVLTDLGIAHIVGRGMVKAGEAMRTMKICQSPQRVVLGTENYMAPEVERGADPNASSDAYSLGVALFELLTGRLPRQGENLSAAIGRRKYDWSATLSWLLNENPACRPARLTHVADELAKRRELHGRAVKKRRRHRRNAAIFALAAAFCSVSAIWWGAFRSLRETRTSNAAQPSASASSSVIVTEAVRRQPVVPSVMRTRIVETNIVSVVVTNVVLAVANQLDSLEKAEQPSTSPAREARTESVCEWYSDADEKTPRAVRFELSNGAPVWFVPQKFGNKTCWISKYPLTVRQWRDAANAVPDDLCELERLLDAEYQLAIMLDDASFACYCDTFVAKYGGVLPNGYVARPMDEVERAALTVGWNHLKDKMSVERIERFADLSQRLKLSRFGQWGQEGELFGRNVFITGLSRRYTPTVFDVGTINARCSSRHIILAPDRQEQSDD